MLRQSVICIDPLQTRGWQTAILEESDGIVCRNLLILGGDFVLPESGKPIRDYWVTNADDRPSFRQIIRRLERIHFKLTAERKSVKLPEFIMKIKD
jgi:hypothetical protein